MNSSINNLDSLREAALTLLREVETLARQQEPQTNGNGKLVLQEEVQRFESELIRQALQRTHGNQRRAAQLLGVKGLVFKLILVHPREPSLRFGCEVG
jgi:DNA-binding NtrC family response regulator